METKEIDVREPLQVCLSRFSGAKGETREKREESLLAPFRAIATKLIHGGYFAVSDKTGVRYRIYIHSVEFYYHEETGPDDIRVLDWVMYHRNPLYGRKKESLATGSLFPHDSGVDITFEDQQDKAEDVRYRASALIRSFQVTTGDNETMVVFEDFPKHIEQESRDVEYYPTHLLQYLLNKIQLPAIQIEWKEKNDCVGEVYMGRRINVFKSNYYKDDKGRAHVNRLDGEPDPRKWAFCKEKITIQLDKQEQFTFE